MAGSQVTAGYFNDPERTRMHFKYFKDHGDTLWFRNGDLVNRDRDGCMHYLNKIDNQIKIRGYRVELKEIENILRNAPSNGLSGKDAQRLLWE